MVGSSWFSSLVTGTFLHNTWSYMSNAWNWKLLTSLSYPLLIKCTFRWIHKKLIWVNLDPFKVLLHQHTQALQLVINNAVLLKLWWLPFRVLWAPSIDQTRSEASQGQKHINTANNYWLLIMSENIITHSPRSCLPMFIFVCVCDK